MTAPWPEAQTDTLVRLWQGGSTSGEIARRLNITRNQVMGKVNRLGLRRAPRPVNYMPKVSKPADRRPPTPIKPQPQVAVSKPIPFIEADHTTCKWPLWHGAKTGKVCGATPVPKKSYCPYHYDQAFIELWSRRRNTA